MQLRYCEYIVYSIYTLRMIVFRESNLRNEFLVDLNLYCVQTVFNHLFRRDRALINLNDEIQRMKRDAYLQ